MANLQAAAFRRVHHLTGLRFCLLAQGARNTFVFSVDEFLQGFPTVSRAQALEALGEAKQLLLSRAS
jgi:hypothetical protein